MMRFLILIYRRCSKVKWIFLLFSQINRQMKGPCFGATNTSHLSSCCCIFSICSSLQLSLHYHPSVLISRLEQHHLKVSVLSPQTNPCYVKPRVNDHQFGIKHYAGEVINNTYTYTHRGKLVWPSSLSGWGSEVVLGWVAGLSLPKSAAGCCGLLPESVQTVSPSSDLSFSWLEQLTCFKKIK